MSRPRSILCAVDLEAGTDEILSYGHALAVGLEAALHAVHVLDVPSSPHPGAVTEALQRASRSLRERFAAAEQCEAELLVMGTRARQAVRRALLGSTAEEVLRRAPLPVLTLPAHAAPWEPPRVVVIAHDLADTAGLDLVAALAPLGLEVHVVHSMPRRSPDFREAKATLRAQVAAAFGDAAAAVSASVVERSVLEASKERVAETGAQLLVVGRSRRSVLGRRFFGTHGIGLVRAADVPVLMVPESAP